MISFVLEPSIIFSVSYDLVTITVTCNVTFHSNPNKIKTKNKIERKIKYSLVFTTLTL